MHHYVILYCEIVMTFRTLHLSYYLNLFFENFNVQTNRSYLSDQDIEMQEPSLFTDESSSESIDRDRFEVDPIKNALSRIDQISEEVSSETVDCHFPKTSHSDNRKNGPTLLGNDSRTSTNSSKLHTDSGQTDSDTDDDSGEKIAFNFEKAKQDSDESDEDQEQEPIRIIRGSAGPPPSLSSPPTPGSSPSKTTKYKISKPSKEKSHRDMLIEQTKACFDAKAESARLLRETNIKLPRHEQVFSLTEIQDKKIIKSPPKSSKQKEKLLKLIGDKEPSFGQGFMELNPNLKNLYEKLAANRVPKEDKRNQPLLDFTSETGDAEDEQKCKENNKKKVPNLRHGIGSKLALVKNTLLAKLTEERMERFMEERVEHENDLRNDEENYLNDVLEKADQEILSDCSSASSSDEQDDDEGSIKNKKYKRRKWRISDSSESEAEPVPEPFSNVDSQQSTTNPYRNMSRLDGRHSNETNTPVTPDPTNSPLQSVSPYSDFKLNFDLDDSVSRFLDSNHAPPESDVGIYLPDVNEDAVDIHSSHFKVLNHESSQDCSETTQDMMNLVWTQTQIINKKPPESPQVSDSDSNDSFIANPALPNEPEEITVTEEATEDIIIKKKKKAKKPGFKVSQFADDKEAEFDADADIANVSGDEDETGLDDYEADEITEALPSASKMEKELGKIHQKLVRDEDQKDLQRMEAAFMGDIIDRAQAKKRKYKWVFSNDFEGAEEKNSSDEDDVALLEHLPDSSDRIREKIERDKVIQSSDLNNISNFQFAEKSINQSTISNTSSFKKYIAKFNPNKRKDRFSAVLLDLKSAPPSKSMAFSSDVKNKQNGKGHSFSPAKKQKQKHIGNKKSIFTSLMD